MTRWNLNIPDKTDRAVRRHLARTGGNDADLSRFVDVAIRREILRRALDSLRNENRDLTADEAQALADEAVDRTRRADRP